jgi:hypothetical protein
MGGREVLVVAVAALSLTACGDRTQPTTTTDDAGVSGRVTVGPQCPVVRAGQPCPDKPAAGVPVTVAEQRPGDVYGAGDVVARTTTRDDGTYRVAVAPGSYVVTADAGMSCELMDVRVSAGAYATADVSCDTGIR